MPFRRFAILRAVKSSPETAWQSAFVDHLVDFGPSKLKRNMLNVCMLSNANCFISVFLDFCNSIWDFFHHCRICTEQVCMVELVQYTSEFVQKCVRILGFVQGYVRMCSKVCPYCRIFFRKSVCNAERATLRKYECIHTYVNGYVSA